jgi:prepilin-type N-terminal cleavage/methylation domain-containing protein
MIGMNSSQLRGVVKRQGFTIVELLVVVVVIGILSVITVVSYTGITQQANVAKSKS